jgi:hypothetical protein
MDETQLDQSQNQLLISALREKLKLSPEERIDAHEKARELVIDLFNAGMGARARSEKAS